MARRMRKQANRKQETTKAKRPRRKQDNAPPTPAPSSAAGGIEPVPEPPGLACPFALLAPSRYQNCTTQKGHASISHLKQHFERAHVEFKTNLRCIQCHAAWKEGKRDALKEYSSHVRTGRCEQTSAGDHFSEEEMKRLAQGLSSGGGDRETKWMWIWNTFFVGHPCPKSIDAKKLEEVMTDRFEAVVASSLAPEGSPSSVNMNVGQFIDDLRERYQRWMEPFRHRVSFQSPPSLSMAPAMPLQEQASSTFVHAGAGRNLSQPSGSGTTGQLEGQFLPPGQLADQLGTGPGGQNPTMTSINTNYGLSPNNQLPIPTRHMYNNNNNNNHNNTTSSAPLITASANQVFGHSDQFFNQSLGPSFDPSPGPSLDQSLDQASTLDQLLWYPYGMVNFTNDILFPGT